MIRLILLIIALVFVLYFVRKLLNHNNHDKKGSFSKKMKYCQFCKSYVTEDQPCINKNFNHSDLE